MAVAPEGAPASRRIIRASRVPSDQPFAPAVLAGNTLYISAQTGRTGAATEASSGIREQTRHAMERIGAVLTEAGMSYPNLVKCHVYLASMDDYAGMNETYRGFFSGRVPARTTIEAAGLPGGAAVQIACIAYGDLSRISVVAPPKGSIPSPLGPYSAGVWAGDTLYLSGMGGQFPDGRPVAGPLAGQVRQTLANIGTTLQAAGLSFADVVSGEGYVTAPGEAGEFPGAYTPMFGSPSTHPRTLVFVPRLPGPIKAEITLVAARGSARGQVIPPADRRGSGARAASAAGVLYTRAEAAERAGARFEQQYKAVLDQQQATLRAAGLSWADVADVQVYLTDLGDLEALDRMFQQTFRQDPPARTVIRVRPNGVQQVQSSLVAMKRDKPR